MLVDSTHRTVRARAEWAVAGGGDGQDRGDKDRQGGYGSHPGSMDAAARPHGPHGAWVEVVVTLKKL